LLIEQYEKRGLRIEVKDNGAGFQADTMDQLLRIDEQENTTNQSIPSSFGIKNVFQRLQLHYGPENIHMYFESTPFYRTSILIQIDNFMDKQQSL
jgi:sensor histidine kinase YesM